LNREEYVKFGWEQAYLFIRESRTKSEKYNKDIKQSIKQFKEKRKKYIFNTEKVEHFFKYASEVYAITMRSTIEQFRITKWQAYWVVNVFGLYKDDYERVIKETLTFIGRGNGKTFWMAVVAYYMTMYDDELQPDVLLFANKLNQSIKSIFENALIPILENSPFLRKKLQGKKRKERNIKHLFDFNSKEIRYRRLLDNKNKTRCKIKPMGSDSLRLDGFKPYLCVLDEIHTYPDNTLYQVLNSATGKRINYLISQITTAGYVKDGYITDEIAYAKKVLYGEKDVDSYFPLLFTLDEDDDVKDENNWYKSNPSLLDGVLRIEELRDKFQKSLLKPKDKIDFLVKRLNVFTDNYSTFIPEDKVKEGLGDIDWEKFKGMQCYAGLDLANNKDICSFSLLFHNVKENKFYFKNIYWLTNNDNRVRKNGIDLTKWVDKGYLIPTDLPTIDFQSVYNTLVEQFKQYKIRLMGTDMYNAPIMISELLRAGIKNIKRINQGIYLNSSIKFLEQLFYENRIVIEDNPVTKWMFNNVVISIWEDDYKLDKNKKKDSIDGIVSMCMAIKMYLEVNTDIERMQMLAYKERMKKNIDKK